MNARMIGNTCRIGCGSKACVCNPGTSRGRRQVKRAAKRRERQQWRKEANRTQVCS